MRQPRSPGGPGFLLGFSRPSNCPIPPTSDQHPIIPTSRPEAVRHPARDDLTLAMRAAVLAGESLRLAFGTPQQIAYKTPDQPVTQADLDADSILRETILRDRPGDIWLSEEGTDFPTHAERLWIVDPLDGTRNFIEERPEFAVCVALVESGTPRLGVVYNPMSTVMYSGLAGHGARRNGEPIRTRPYPDRNPTIVLSATEARQKDFEPLRTFGRIRTLGSTALKIALVAEGSADLYISCTPKGIWDVCAAGVVLAEAGGAAFSADGSDLDIGSGAMVTAGGMLAIGDATDEQVTAVMEVAQATVFGHRAREEK